MLWFNSRKDLGALRTPEGDVVDVPGAAFARGERPLARCAGRAVEFESLGGSLSGVTFVAEVSPRRARLRHRR